MDIHLSVYLSIYPSIYLSSIYLSIYLYFFFLSIYLTMDRSIYLSVCLSTCAYSIHIYVCTYVCMHICLYLCMSHFCSCMHAFDTFLQIDMEADRGPHKSAILHMFSALSFQFWIHNGRLCSLYARARLAMHAPSSNTSGLD